MLRRAWHALRPATVLMGLMAALMVPATPGALAASGSASRAKAIRLHAELSATLANLTSSQRELATLAQSAQSSYRHVQELVQKEAATRQQLSGLIAERRAAESRLIGMQKRLARARRIAAARRRQVHAVLRADQLLSANPLGPLAALLGAANLLAALTQKQEWSRVERASSIRLVRAGQAEIRVRLLTRAAVRAAAALALAVSRTRETADRLAAQRAQAAQAYRSLERERANTGRVVNALTVHAEGLRLAIEALAAIVRAQGTKVTNRGSLWVLISAVAQAYGLNPGLVWAVVMTESGGNPGAVSPTGAVGLMQLEPGTAHALGVSNPYNAKQNLRGGVSYLAGLIRQYHGNVALALAAYNGGPGAVASGRVPAGEEGYVQTVLGYLSRARR